MTVAQLKQGLGPLLELPVELVLVSHGEPVLADGQRALATALALEMTRGPLRLG